MKPFVRGACLALSVLVAGCAASIDETAVVVPSQTYLEITEAAAGPLTPSTGYSAAAIQAAMPGYSAVPITAGLESRTVAALGVFTDGIQVLQVHRGPGGRIGAVHGVTPRLTGPNGERIGQTFGELRLRRGSCRVGRDLWRGMALCTARGADNVTLVLAISQYQGPYDRLAPDGELENAVLQRIVWEPR